MNTVHNEPQKYFAIRLTSRIQFKNLRGVVTDQFEVGEYLKSSHDTGLVFVTPLGGIYHDEAERVLDDSQITYSHVNGDTSVRSQQYAKDHIPGWATDIRAAETPVEQG